MFIPSINGNNATKPWMFAWRQPTPTPWIALSSSRYSGSRTFPIRSTSSEVGAKWNFSSIRLFRGLSHLCYPECEYYLESCLPGIEYRVFLEINFVLSNILFVSFLIAHSIRIPRNITINQFEWRYFMKINFNSTKWQRRKVK